MSKNRISEFPAIPDFYTKTQFNQTLISYGNSLIFTGSSFVSTNSFKLEMNTFGNYDDGFNARFYVGCTVKSASGVIMWESIILDGFITQFNNSNNTHNFRNGTIDADDISTCTFTYGGSSQGIFFLNIEIRATNPTITQLYVRIS